MRTQPVPRGVYLPPSPLTPPPLLQRQCLRPLGQHRPFVHTVKTIITKFIRDICLCSRIAVLCVYECVFNRINVICAKDSGGWYLQLIECVCLKSLTSLTLCIYKASFKFQITQELRFIWKTCLQCKMLFEIFYSLVVGVETL